MAEKEVRHDAAIFCTVKCSRLLPPGSTVSRSLWPKKIVFDVCTLHLLLDFYTDTVGVL